MRVVSMRIKSHAQGADGLVVMQIWLQNKFLSAHFEIPLQQSNITLEMLRWSFNFYTN